MTQLMLRPSERAPLSPQKPKLHPNDSTPFLFSSDPSSPPYLICQRTIMDFCGDMMVADSSMSYHDVVDVIAMMQRKESTIYRRSDYLSSADGASKETQDHASSVVDGAWRQRIVEWMYGVVDHCSLRRDSVAVATCYLDLCVERGVIESRQHFQLAAMTALQLAIKLYDSTVVQLKSLIKLGRGLFTEQDVIEMERTILMALQWQVHPPTSICFLRQFLRLLPATVSPAARYKIAEVTRFISELSVCLYKFVEAPPSALTYAGMLIAMERIDEGILPVWQRQQIFQTMATAAHLDCQSPQICQVVSHLHASLEKNVSLQDLMITIDAQCRAEGYSPCASPTEVSSSSLTHNKNSNKRPIPTMSSSPREVASPQPRRA